jgi:hypothetical protein
MIEFCQEINDGRDFPKTIEADKDRGDEEGGWCRGRHVKGRHVRRKACQRKGN